MKLLATIVLSFAAVFCTVLLVIVVRTFTLTVRSDGVKQCEKLDHDFIPATEEVLERFRKAIRFQTVSQELHVYNRPELERLLDFIHSDYPTIHSSSLVEHEVVGNYSLLYSIKGSNSALQPYILMAHLDVVPVADPDKWEAPPFEGEIRNGFIYGRGTIDFKQGVIGILEALEYLLASGRKPVRGFYVAFGHDEEVSGQDGARAIGDLLMKRGVHGVEFILDEGLTIVNNVIPGIDRPVAMVGSSEKGQVFLELLVKGTPSHSSMPEPESPIGILANAVARLEKYPQPSMFGYGPEKDTFEHLAPEMKLPFRMVMTNLWLFGPVVSWILSLKPVTNAIIRTVTAVTMFQAGVKINVNAPDARAYVNHRIHPAQSIEQVIEYDRQIINDDRVQITVLYRQEALPISPSGDNDFGYQTIKNSIRQVWTESVVAPGTLIGNTDTKHYTKLSNNIYRFSPTFMFQEDVPRFHGNNERISIKNYEQAINFYYHLMRNSDKEKLTPSHSHGEL
ncbi:hypothetical protein CHS0354_009016 [Potamilus streckersoni]|uniref:Peptidase M20 dimerisation domain-containing protein n=1 Tax=Potamilus streckersoni TaxID=2493646 RepID=A0AAE0WDE1_9BIVA|nr:hypothetical protein CHS0354_009016 [Potamilus streckersoni]